MNVYPAGPVKGPDGYFNLLWIWRDTSDACLNHDLSYARSFDLINWETASGSPLSLPITPADKTVIVDPVSAERGLINVGHRIGFDANVQTVLSYHKYDQCGNR